VNGKEGLVHEQQIAVNVLLLLLVVLRGRENGKGFVMSTILIGKWLR
jgi:hypothetical protein